MPDICNGREKPRRCLRRNAEPTSRIAMIYAGVELGGTKCAAILARSPHEVLARDTIPTTSPDETLGRLEGILLEWKREHEIGALGVGSFGPVDVDPASASWGQILATPKAGWAGTRVAVRLRDKLEVPVIFDTDVNAAALGEMRWGSGKGVEDFSYVTVGTGVGVGLIVSGRPTRGFGHCELGHIRVARLPGDEFEGSCPFHGDCVEGLAAGPSLAARVGAEQMQALSPDDPIWDSVSWALAQLCHAIVCAAAPRRIAMGGGVIDNHPHLLSRIQFQLVESLNGYLQLPSDGDYVCAPGLGRGAGPLGAIALAMTVRP